MEETASPTQPEKKDQKKLLSLNQVIVKIYFIVAFSFRNSNRAITSIEGRKLSLLRMSVIPNQKHCSPVKLNEIQQEIWEVQEQYLLLKNKNVCSESMNCNNRQFHTLVNYVIIENEEKFQDYYCKTILLHKHVLDISC